MRWPPRRQELDRGEVATVDEGLRPAVVKAATTLYRTRGYREVSLADVARVAGTREEHVRALFDTGADLFEAVYRGEQELIARRIADRYVSPDPVEMLHEGVDGWLEAMSDPGSRRVLVLDAADAMGWQRWRQAGDRYGRMLIEVVLVDAIERGAISPQPERALGHVLAGALESGVQYVAHEQDQDAAMAQVAQVLHGLVDALVAAGPRSDRVSE